MELVIARNPDPDSTLPLLIRVPVDGGLVFRTRGSWPRTSALYCHPVPRQDWPQTPDVVERITLRACARRGASIDIVADRARESRSQLIFTVSRGRQTVFWQAPRTRKQARPQVNLPTARAAGVRDLTILVDSHERYAYRFAHQQVQLEKRTLSCGDYAVELDDRVVAAVERKSLDDLIGSITNGRLRFALAELAALPRAAVVVEERYSKVFATTYTRPSLVADGLAELAVRFPNVPVLFCETRALAEEWTYRYLAAAYAWLSDAAVADARVASVDTAPSPVAALVSEPSTRTVRRWALDRGLPVSDRGRLRPEIVAAWQQAHPS